MTSNSPIEQIYRQRTPGSRKLAEQAVGLFPSGVTHDARYMQPYGIYADRAQGSRKWDVDGNEYVDYFGGHGAHILGHGNAAIVAAVQQSIERGTQLGSGTADEIEYGALVKELVPCAERLRFTMSGTEATHLALRMARAFTGKSGIIRFQTHFHGWHDNVASGFASHFDGTTARGIPPSQARDTVLLPPGDIDAVRSALRESGDIAALILEPTGTHFGQVPLQAGFVAQLRELTARYGVLLIFDEVITGFRVAPGGAQQVLGIVPDLSTHAKIIAGGLPGGAVCGRKEVLDVLDFEAMAQHEQEKVLHNGTFNANLVSVRAGIAMLRQIRDGSACQRANAFGERLRRDLNAILVRRRLPWAVYGEYSGFFIFTNPKGLNIGPEDFDPHSLHFSALLCGHSVRARKLKMAMVNEGVDLLYWPGGLVSAVNGPEDLELTLSAFDAAVHQVCREEGI